MPTKRHKNSQPSQPSEADTRGVWALQPRLGRPKPFGCQWRDRVWDERARVDKWRTFTAFFSSVAARDEHMRAVADERRLGGASKPAPAELREWRAFLSACGGVPWQKVLAGYHASLSQGTGATCTVKVLEWSQTYLANCKTLMLRGDMSEDNERHKRRIVPRFAANCGDRLLDEIKPKEVEVWIDSLGYGSSATFNSTRKHLLAFFNAAVLAELIKVNPIAKMPWRRHVVDNRDKILTPQETATLFAFAMDHPVFKRAIGLGALEAFAGVRFSSAYRFAKEDMNIKERSFILPAAKLKTGQIDGKSHHVDTTDLAGLENLWEWLKLAPDNAWTLAPRQWLELKSSWFIAAGVQHPRNCLRKSFATYDLNAHRNPGRTAYILGHRDQGELWDTYKGNASHENSKLYQSISKRNVRDIGGDAA